MCPASKKFIPAGKCIRRFHHMHDEFWAEKRYQEDTIMSTTKTELLKIIKSKCLDCTCNQITEVRLCPNNNCPLWPFRMAKDPYRTPKILSEAQKENLAAGRQKLRVSETQLS